MQFAKTGLTTCVIYLCVLSGVQGQHPYTGISPLYTKLISLMALCRPVPPFFMRIFTSAGS